LRKKKKNKTPIAVIRINILFFLVFVLFATIIFRLSFVQLVEGQKYKDLSETNSTKTIPFTAPRGIIKDSNLVPLVKNKTVWTMIFQIEEDQEQDFEAIANKLAKITAKPEDDLQELNKSYLERMDIGVPYFRASKYIPRVIERDINEKVRAYIEEHRTELPGVEVIPDQMRNYVNGDFMAQVLGYTRDIPENELEYYQALGYKLTDRIGRYGLEKQYENVLHGTDGQYIVEVNRRYERIAQKAFKNPIPGNNIILTLDQEFQKAVEKALETKVEELKASRTKASNDVEKAIAIVMDPNTGAILAMGNYPRFDPNWFNGPISKELYDNSIAPYAANSAIRDRYPMGSTIKPLTVLIGLSEGVINTNTVIYDSGRILYDYAKGYDGSTIPLYMRNYGNHVYGSLTLQTALQKSSNIFMTEIALKMKNSSGINTTIDTMRYYSEMFGLSSKTGIDLPEENESRTALRRLNDGTIVPNSNIVQQSIGQNDTYTALQLAQYVSTIANNGYRMKPYLVQAIEEGTASGTTGKILYKREPEVLNKVNISEKNIKAVQAGMLLVTQPGGTAYSSLGNLPIKVAAKTGTAQAAERTKEDNAVLIGYAPYDNPKIAFAIIVPHGGGGGSVAGPIAKEIVKAYLEIYKDNVENDA